MIWIYGIAAVISAGVTSYFMSRKVPQILHWLPALAVCGIFLSLAVVEADKAREARFELARQTLSEGIRVSYVEIGWRKLVADEPIRNDSVGTLGFVSYLEGDELMIAGLGGLSLHNFYIEGDSAFIVQISICDTVCESSDVCKASRGCKGVNLNTVLCLKRSVCNGTCNF